MWHSAIPRCNHTPNFGIPTSKIYAPDSTSILKTRSEVKIKVIVAQGWYVTLRHPKMHVYAKFGIPISNYMRDMLWTQIFYKLGQRSRSHWLENGMRHFVIPRCTHTLHLGFLSQDIYKRYAPDTKMLKLGQRSRSQWPENGTRHSAIPWWIHIPNLGFPPKKIGDMLRTQLF